MEYRQWLRDVKEGKKIKEKSIDKYVSSVDLNGGLTKLARKNSLISDNSKLLDIQSLSQFKGMLTILKSDNEFKNNNHNSTALKHYLSYLKWKENTYFSVFPDEVEGDKKFLEGRSKVVNVNVYERNPKARQKCIDHHGYSCAVCEFDFEEKYGEIGKNFIHVHHLIEISTISEEYEIDPIKDLKPVCPNCHAMIHKKKPAYTIEEVKSFLKMQD